MQWYKSTMKLLTGEKRVTETVGNSFKLHIDHISEKVRAYVCLCVCVRERERERMREKINSITGCLIIHNKLYIYICIYTYIP